VFVGHCDGKAERNANPVQIIAFFGTIPTFDQREDKVDQDHQDEEPRIINPIRHPEQTDGLIRSPRIPFLP
jgi:hypothetical protein